MYSGLKSRLFMVFVFTLKINVGGCTDLNVILEKMKNQIDISQHVVQETVEPLDDEYVIVIDKNKDNEDSVNESKDLDVNHHEAKYVILLNKHFKPVQRRFRDLKKDREEKKKAKLVKDQHDKKVKEIVDFMEDHYLTTNYLYNEVQRIKKHRTVKDDLRWMIEYLGKPGKEDQKKKVLECYHKVRDDEKTPFRWNQEPNNLVINVLKDPYNYGYVN